VTLLTVVVPVQPDESVAVTTTLLVPVFVGVPDTPPEASIVSPAGSPVALQVIVPVPPD
jgi:hypothetical protein